MENYEVMNNEEVMEQNEIEAIETNEGRNAIVPVLITTAVIGAGAALFAVGKKLWNKHKAKKDREQVIDAPTVYVVDKDEE